MDHKLKLCALLGLAATATDAEIESAVSVVESNAEEIANRGCSTDEESETLKNRVTELETENKALLTEQVERDLVEFDSVISNKDSVRKQLMANRKDTLELLKGLKAKEPAKPSPASRAPLHNRNAAGAPAPVTDGNVADEALAKKISNRAHEIASTQKIPYTAAFDKAKGELAPAK